jgi:hypothetical protein
MMSEAFSTNKEIRMTDPTSTPPQDPNAGYGQQPAAAPYSAPAASPYSGAPAQPNKTNVLAIVSLVSAFFVSVVGIITGHIALSQIKKTGENGRGLALAGTVLGYVFTLGWIILVVVWVIAAIALANAGYSSTDFDY